MELLHTSRSSGAGHAHGTDEGYPRKRLRSSVSHVSLLNPLVCLLRDPVGTIGSIVEGLGYGIETPEEVEAKESEQKRLLLLLTLRGAQTCEEWEAAATKLDILEGNNVWKLEDECQEYDVKLLQTRLDQLQQARRDGDAKQMLFFVRTALMRDLGGMGNLRLYKHSRVGTKALIERYIDTVLKVIPDIVESCGHGDHGELAGRNTMDQFIAARQAFGRSALLLSGGGTLGMNHIGVIKSLFEAKLLPRIISGSSAGSIVSAILGTKTDEEIPGVLKDFCYGDLAVFEKEGEEEGVLAKVARFLKFGALFDISNLVRVMRDMLGDITFQEAYNRTRRISNVCVSSASLYELPRLLNYVTAPNVMIWSAVAASCSVPFIFSAAQLLAKDPKSGEQVPWNPSPQRWIDGSVDNDLPMTRLAEMFNVNHFIVSQVNPHVVPFLLRDEDDMADEAQRATCANAAGPGWMHNLANLAKGEALHRMHVLAELGFFPNTMTKVRSVLGQRYSGDITICPEISYTHFPNVLQNPSTEFVVQAMLNGQRATWPKLSRIRNHCAIELALDDAVQQTRARVAFSPSQVELRNSEFSRASYSTRPERGRPRRSSKGSHQSTKSQFQAREVPGRSAAHRPIRSLLDPPSTLPSLPNLKIPGPEPSAYFSSAESATSSLTLYSDEDDTENLLSDSTLDSPPSPQPSLWPSTRQLFPYASLPATPSIAGRTFNVSSPSPPVPTTPTAASLTMTPSSANVRLPSSPEMFHRAHATTLPTIRSQVSTPEPLDVPVLQNAAAPRPNSGLDLQLDFSGTRGMMRRRGRSLSTGLKGLHPPGRQ